MLGMPSVHLAQFRSAWTSWAGVSLTFVTATFGLVLGALLLQTALDGEEAGLLAGVDAAALTFMGWTNIILVAIVSFGVISAATALVIASRRGSIARLALAGATPSQVRGTILLQLAVVTLVCALVGNVLAVSTVQWFVDGQLRERDLQAVVGALSASRSIPTMLTANLFCVGVALVGGWRNATAASRISPVEALRATDPVPPRRGRVWRWVLVALGVVAIGVIVVGFLSAAPSIGPDAGDLSFQMAIFLLVLSAWVLAQAAPVTIVGLTRAWTSLVPRSNASWMLARSTILARHERLAKSVAPVLYAIALLFGLIAVVDTLTASMRASGWEFQLSSASFFSIFSLIGTALIVAVAGSVGSLLMMSKQRDAELALAGIAGATPGQRLLVPALEGLIITVTAVLLGLVATGVGVGFIYLALDLLIPVARVAVSWGLLAGIVLACLLVTVAATVLPTLQAQRRPAPYVVARLAAE